MAWKGYSGHCCQPVSSSAVTGDCPGCRPPAPSATGDARLVANAATAHATATDAVAYRRQGRGVRPGAVPHRHRITRTTDATIAAAIRSGCRLSAERRAEAP